jgi:hypothetical protein
VEEGEGGEECRAVVAAAHLGDFSIGGSTQIAATETLPALRLIASAGAQGAALVPYLPSKWWRVGEDAISFERRCAEIPHSAIAPRPAVLASGIAHTIDRGSIGIYATLPTLDDIDDEADEIEDASTSEDDVDDFELDGDWDI